MTRRSTDTSERMQNRRKNAGMAVVTAFASLALFAGLVTLRGSSDAESSEVPTPSIDTSNLVAVERGVLEEQRQYVGRVAREEEQEIQATTGTDPVSVVTDSPFAVGDSVTFGVSLVEVNFRPVFLLEGAIPPFRTLSPGDSGGDVLQLQAALQSLGFEIPDDEKGSFGADTAAAIDSLYGRQGYEPIEGRVLMNEVFYTQSRFPTVTKAPYSRGELVDPEVPLVEIGGGAAFIEVSLLPGDPLMEAMPVTMTDSSGATATATVSRVEERISQQGQTPGRVAIIELGGQNALTPPADQTVQVRAVVSSTPEPVLHVPIAALVTDGQSRPALWVVVDGVAHLSTVTVGQLANGHIEIASSDDSIQEGASVLMVRVERTE